ncbi:MAG: metallophosphoesterase [Myxococcales bacterium]|nr:metallophosphoesterase [Myxococcales bacterium]
MPAHHRLRERLRRPRRGARPRVVIRRRPLGEGAGAQTATSVRFAAIGDYGFAGAAEAAVANLVRSWNPDHVITLGDNNYEVGSATTIDANVGQYYRSYIFPYTGSYGPGATTNRFWPALGNHDWGTPGATPYLNYFTLPTNGAGERYYQVVQGPVHFFVLDSDPAEPHGTSSTSIQAQWLRAALAASTAPWKIVYFHHAPYSSGNHGSTLAMRWPFQAWGAHAVLAGHDHHYERFSIDGIPYFVNGLGGRSLTPWAPRCQAAWSGTTAGTARCSSTPARPRSRSSSSPPAAR